MDNYDILSNAVFARAMESLRNKQPEAAAADNVCTWPARHTRSLQMQVTLNYFDANNNRNSSVSFEHSSLAYDAVNMQEHFALYVLRASDAWQFMQLEECTRFDNLASNGAIERAWTVLDSRTRSYLGHITAEINGSAI